MFRTHIRSEFLGNNQYESFRFTHRSHRTLVLKPTVRKLVIEHFQAIPKAWDTAINLEERMDEIIMQAIDQRMSEDGYGARS